MLKEQYNYLYDTMDKMKMLTVHEYALLTTTTTKNKEITMLISTVGYNFVMHTTFNEILEKNKNFTVFNDLLLSIYL